MPWSPLPAEGSDPQPPTRLNELVDRLLAGLGSPSVEAVVAIHDRWPEVVGAEVAPHARVVAVEDGHLRVSADSPSWASHIRWSEDEILTRLSRMVGAGVVGGLSVVVHR